MSELSRRSGVPVATIKFYLREGLLPPGHATAVNQADYGEDHLRRLRLARALTVQGGLSVSATREVLEAVDAKGPDLFEALGVTHYALRPAVAGAGEEPEDGASAATVDALLERTGWFVGPHSPSRTALAAGLRALREVGAERGVDDLLPYAELAAATARLDLDRLAGLDDALDIAERALVLTVLMEPVLATLRRMAQENEAALRYAGGEGAEGGSAGRPSDVTAHREPPRP